MPLQLTGYQVAHILLEKSTFSKIEALTGVPWEAIASIWYRESGSVAPPKTPGGQFQFDPLPQHGQMKELATLFPSISLANFEAYWTKGFNNFEAAAFFAALWLQHKAPRRLSLDSPDEDIKLAFWGYNGRAFGDPDHSNYVVNGLDDAHMNMHINGTIPDGHGGRTEIHTVDQRPGAFTVYKQLRALPQ